MEIPLMRMARFLSIFALVLFFSPLSVDAASTLSKPPNNLGLVGYWSFNEATSTQATDFSGNGRHGTLSGNAVTWINGKRGSALQFGGTDDNVNLGAIAALDGAQKVTVSAWIYDTAGAASKSIFSRFSASPNDPSVGLYTSDPGNGGGQSISFTPDGQEAVFSTGNVHQTNRWEHWVAVYDGSQATDLDKVVLYLNGVAQAKNITSTPLASTVDSSAQVIRIGADSDQLADFTGLIDEVRVYTRALSASEVAALAGTTPGGGGAVRIGNSSRTLQQGTTLGSGLVGHWTFDGGDTRWTSPTAGVAYDRSATGAIGTLTGMSRSTDAGIGTLGQALQFDEIDNYVLVSDNASHRFGVAQDFSVAAWVRARPIGGSYAGVVGRKLSRATNRLGYLISHENGLARFYISDGVDEVFMDSTTVIDDYEWHHVLATVSRSGNATLYVDGVVEGAPQSVSAVGDIDEVGIDVTIGDIGFTGQPFDGLIDDVRLYNRVLTSSEAKQLFNLGRLRIR